MPHKQEVSKTDRHNTRMQEVLPCANSQKNAADNYSQLPQPLLTANDDWQLTASSISSLSLSASTTTGPLNSAPAESARASAICRRQHPAAAHTPGQQREEEVEA